MKMQGPRKPMLSTTASHTMNNKTVRKYSLSGENTDAAFSMGSTGGVRAHRFNIVS